MTWMIFAFLLAVGIVINWYAVLSSREGLDNLTKPGVILLLILGFTSQAELDGPALWFWAGLAFSLLGDILLNLPERFFPGGLAAFAATHLCYIFALRGLSSPEQALISAAAACALYISARLVYRSSRTDPLKAALQGPVSLYIFLIGLMLSSALWTNFRAGWTGTEALLVSLGAVFFTFSDSVLAWDKFIQPLSWRGPGVRFSYHLGQISLTLGISLHYSVN